MNKEIDPAVLIMENVAKVDIDKYIESAREEAEHHDDEKENTASGRKSNPIQSKVQKRKGFNNGPMLPEMKNLRLRESTLERFRLAKHLFCAEVGGNVSNSEFLDRLLNAGLSKLSPEAAKKLQQIK